ncbi:hypothetical protein [Henriciella marina]|uniref:hypothetical protein n=1 Tax=Henriciella marina TaxID=453851 RepID=UPI000378DE9A|nr:hypothetical protein [Henriciella marina]
MSEQARPKPEGAGAAAARALSKRVHEATRGLIMPAWQSETNMLSLLQCIYGAGREDLAFARLLEGHVDAVQTVLVRGDEVQVARLQEILNRGSVLGVWNADLKDAPLSLQAGRLMGGKAFASGAGLLTHALVTLNAGHKARVQLVLLDLAETPPAIDRSWWNVAGMQASETHLVRWQGAGFDEAWTVGEPGDYEREPCFSGGALRFVAAHAGGVAGLFDKVRDHLLKTGRANSEQQTERLARLYRCADLSACAVRAAKTSWFRQSTEEKLASVAHARMTVCELAEEALMLAQRSVGVSSLFHAHPLCKQMMDLTVYLKQPAPDAKVQEVGRAAANGLLVPDL